MRPITLSLLLQLLLLAAVPAQAAEPLRKLERILRNASDYKQRLAAVIGLARLGDRAAVPALVAALNDADHTVRGTAATALGQLGGPQAEAALEALLPGEKNDYVIGQAQTALAALIRRGQDQTGSPDGLKVAGTTGHLDQEVVQDGVDRRLPLATACFNHEFQHAPYLAGRIILLFRIALDGTVKTLRVGHSDLGSLAAERCIVEAMRGASFGKPEGGEAEFTVPLSFGGGTPAPILDPASSLAARRLQRSCKKVVFPGEALPPALQISLYLDARGGVLNAGFSASGSEVPAQLADGLLARLKRLELGPRPEGGVAKLVYPFFCASR